MKNYKITQFQPVNSTIHDDYWEVILFETNSLKEAEEEFAKQIEIFENLIRDAKRDFPNARYFSEEMSDQTYHPNVPIEEITCIDYGFDSEHSDVFRPELITNRVTK